MAMSLTSTVTSLATAETEKLRELPMPDWVFGVTAFAAFLLLLGVLWSFRNTASKYDTPSGLGQGAVRHSPGSPGSSNQGSTSHGPTDHGAHF